MKKIISIVAPLYNEELLVSKYCEETLKVIEKLKDQYDFELVLVNDGSKDNTYSIMLKEQEMYPDLITTICLSRNFGLEGAVDAGIRKAVGDAVVVMDADLQDPPDLISKMLLKWEQGADIVIGKRANRKSDSLFKKASASFYYRILDFLSGKLKLEKNAANYRLLSRKALDQILDLPEVNSVFRVVVPFVGMRTEVIEYDRDKRFAGKTKYSLKTMIPYALDGLTGISVEPLRKLKFIFLCMIVLFIISLIGLIVATGTGKTFFLYLSTLSILFGMLFFAISVIAEYLAQIMIEVKGRPTSIIYDYKPCGNIEKKGK